MNILVLLPIYLGTVIFDNFKDDCEISEQQGLSCPKGRTATAWKIGHEVYFTDLQASCLAAPNFASVWSNGEFANFCLQPDCEKLFKMKCIKIITVQTTHLASTQEIHRMGFQLWTGFGPAQDDPECLTNGVQFMTKRGSIPISNLFGLRMNISWSPPEDQLIPQSYSRKKRSVMYCPTVGLALGAFAVGGARCDMSGVEQQVKNIVETNFVAMEKTVKDMSHKSTGQIANLNNSLSKLKEDHLRSLQSLRDLKTTLNNLSPIMGNFANTTNQNFQSITMKMNNMEQRISFIQLIDFSMIISLEIESKIHFLDLFSRTKGENGACNKVMSQATSTSSMYMDLHRRVRLQEIHSDLIGGLFQNLSITLSGHLADLQHFNKHALYFDGESVKTQNLISSQSLTGMKLLNKIIKNDTMSVIDAIGVSHAKKQILFLDLAIGIVFLLFAFLFLYKPNFRPFLQLCAFAILGFYFIASSLYAILHAWLWFLI